jgi:hypothetical protein
MSPMILVYVLLIAVVVIGLIAASVIYRTRRRGRIEGGIPHAAPPLTDDRPPRPPR